MENKVTEISLFWKAFKKEDNTITEETLFIGKALFF